MQNRRFPGLRILAARLCHRSHSFPAHAPAVLVDEWLRDSADSTQQQLQYRTTQDWRQRTPLPPMLLKRIGWTVSGAVPADQLATGRRVRAAKLDGLLPDLRNFVRRPQTREVGIMDRAGGDHGA